MSQELRLQGKYGEGKVALVDDDVFGYVRIFKWIGTRVTYRSSYCIVPTTYLKGTKLKLSRFVLCVGKDDIRVVDHINGDTLDNRRENLRLCTQQQNNCNRHKWSIGNSASKYKGVCWNKVSKCWVVNIKHEGKSIHLGLFDDEEMAAKAFDEAARHLHKEFAQLNF